MQDENELLLLTVEESIEEMKKWIKTLTTRMANLETIVAMIRRNRKDES
jgi:hypothetical protein